MPDPNPENRDFSDKLDVPEIDFIIHEPGIWSFIIGEAVGFSPDRNSKSQSSKKLQALFAEKPIAPKILDGLRSGIGKYGENLLRFTFAALSSDKGKSYIKEADRFCDSFESFRNQYPGVEKIVIPEFEKAEDELESKRGEYIEQMQTIIEFFRPKRSTADVRKVLVVASGDMLSSVGTAYNIEEETITIFDGGDVETGTHEFLHSIINPLVEKVDFTDEEIERISQLIPPNIRDNYEMGAGAISEILINAYLRVFRKGTSVKEALMGRYKDLDRSGYDRAMQSGTHFAEMMGKIGVKSFSDWTDEKKDELYQKYFEDGLMERCVDFYKEYAEKRKLNPFLTFEDFFKANYKKLLE